MPGQAQHSTEVCSRCEGYVDLECQKLSVGLQKEETTRKRVEWEFLVILKSVVLARGKVRQAREAGEPVTPAYKQLNGGNGVHCPSLGSQQDMK